MRIFLTGATGYIGSAVAHALRAGGHEVAGLARTGEAARKLEAQGIGAHRGNLREPDQTADAAAAFDGVIHTAFENDPNAPLIDEAFVRAVLDKLSGTGKTFIYTSGVWVMGNTDKKADEDSPLDPPAVVAWRPAVERKVLAAAERNIRTVVIRPGMVYGRGAGIVAGFVKSARETGSALVVGSGENHWSFVHVDDLADLYLRALNAKPGSLYVAATEVRRVRDVAEAASRAAGAQGRVQSWELEEAYHNLGPAVAGLVLDQRVSTHRAEQELGWRPRTVSVLDEFR